MDIREVKGYVRENLHGMAHAIANNADISLVTAVQIKEGSGEILLWENVQRNYLLKFVSAEVENGELLVTDEVDTWVLRALTPAQERSFKSSMTKAGFEYFE